MRLIDADKLKKVLEMYFGHTGGAAVLAQLIDAQETEPHWIPCTERLPEENDYKSCIECLNGAVWYFTENGTIGVGYYYKSTKEWSTTDDLKTDGKVIAWMPLPEPYQEGADNEVN